MCLIITVQKQRCFDLIQVSSGGTRCAFQHGCDWFSGLLVLVSYELYISYMSTIIFGQVLILFVFSALSPFCPTVVSFVGGLWYCLFLCQFFHSASHLSCGQDVRRALKTFAHLIGVLFTFYWSTSLSCGRAANGLKIPLLLHQQVSWVCPCFSPHLEGHVFLQRNRIIAKNLDNQIYSFSESFDFYPHLSLFFPQIRLHQAKYKTNDKLHIYEGTTFVVSTMWTWASVLTLWKSREIP